MIVIVLWIHMTQNVDMINVNKVITSLRNKNKKSRKNLKKVVQKWIDNKEISYSDAIRIFEASGYFDIGSYIINKGIFNSFNEYISEHIYRMTTIYFSEIIDWLRTEENISEDYYKEIYDYTIKNNVVGYIYDW